MNLNMTELMWDDAQGTNLQMALFDAVGKELGGHFSLHFPWTFGYELIWHVYQTPDCCVFM